MRIKRQLWESVGSAMDSGAVRPGEACVASLGHDYRIFACVQTAYVSAPGICAHSLAGFHALETDGRVSR